MEMPFGKHRGKEITEIPRGYLKWLENNVTIQGELAEEVYAVVRGIPRRPVKNVEDVVCAFEDQL